MLSIDWIIGKNISIDNKLSIKGIKMLEYQNNIYISEYIPYYTYTIVNQNDSYFYLNNNQLKYKLMLNVNSTLERITAIFDINNKLTDNATLFFLGRETLTCYGSVLLGLVYSGIGFPSYIFLETDSNLYLSILPFSRLIDKLIFVSSDLGSNNTFTGYTYTGYFSDIRIIYNYELTPEFRDITITVLSLTAIM
ncbi:unnamed protein product, partial [marine sediment metagenome]